MQQDLIILYGGGLDSGVTTTQAWQQNRNPLLLYFDYGAKATRGELKSLAYVGDKFKFETMVVKIPPEIIPPSPLTEGAMIEAGESQLRNEVPGRNVLFAALAFSLAKRRNIRAIWIGADPPTTWIGFKDSKQPTFDAFNSMTAYAYGEDAPRLYAPLLAMKDARYYIRYALRSLPELFKVTFSCYESSTEEECGQCKHCIRKARLLADLQAGIFETEKLEQE